MSLPGPTAGTWALGLLLWAAAAAVLGESLRLLLSRSVPSWQNREPIQRGLTDFYLGGAVLYFVAALPVGGFVAPVVFGLPIVGAVGLVALVILRRRSRTPSRLLESLRPLARPTYLFVLLSALALFALEIAVAAPIGTGNTFDSGLLTTYTALLVRNHSIPLSFHPYASTSILYPQGSTVWLGWAQEVMSLPPARTSLIVTPLFFALAPLAGFVFGRRWFRSDRAGLAVALVLAWLAPATRGMVAGSNDFVFAFPLVLLLAGEASSWVRSVPTWGDAAGFGLLAGYSAAMNPVGAEWLLPAVLITALLLRPALGGRPLRWFVGWLLALATALVAVIPSLVVLVEGHASPGFIPGAAAAPSGSPTGISTPQFLGSIDPFLFRAGDVQLSPVPALRLELAILLTLGLVVLIVVGRRSALGRYLDEFRRFALGAGLSLVAGLALSWWASTGFGPAIAVSVLTSAGEQSIWLFTVYVLIAAVPLVLALERVWGTWPTTSASTAVPPVPTPSASWHRTRNGNARTLVPLAIALVIVVPGVTLTPTSLAPVLTQYYHDFGNVSSSDFALLEYAGSHLPAGARVLIAPGSAADFLPGYAANVVLLYPLVPGWEWINASYRLVVDELSNATLNRSGLMALAALDVGYIIVTGNSTVLWPAFSPVPFLNDPSTFHEMWNEGDAYLFRGA